jgi:hypothetical protein
MRFNFPGRLLVPVLILSFLTQARASDPFRMSADFTIKQREGEKGQLVTGKAYLDKKVGKLCYHIQFPEPGYWVMQDSFLYEFDQHMVLVEKRPMLYHPGLSLYSLILTRSLDDLGLKETGFTVQSLETQGDSLAIAEWVPPPSLRKKIGKAFLTHKRKMLHAAAFFDAKDHLVARVYYQKTELVDGIPVPVETLSIAYTEEGERMTLTRLKNVVFNEMDNDLLYNFPLP